MRQEHIALHFPCDLYAGRIRRIQRRTQPKVTARPIHHQRHSGPTVGQQFLDLIREKLGALLLLSSQILIEADAKGDCRDIRTLFHGGNRGSNPLAAESGRRVY